jgi:hypothetical protein
MRYSISRLMTALLLALAACGDDQNPEEARALWDRIHEQNYRSWARAPGYESRRESNAPHGDDVDIYVNEVIAAALEKGEAITTWPIGSQIVKDGFDGSDLELVAAMEKGEDGWFWAEWDADGDSIYSGKPEVCTDCHAAGADGVRAFGFPQ